LQCVFSERSELGARLRARRQFAPAIQRRTRSFFLTFAIRECQLQQ
jgi:hypothetical protein